MGNRDDDSFALEWPSDEAQDPATAGDGIADLGSEDAVDVWSQDVEDVESGADADEGAAAPKSDAHVPSVFGPTGAPWQADMEAVPDDVPEATERDADRRGPLRLRVRLVKDSTRQRF